LLFAVLSRFPEIWGLRQNAVTDEDREHRGRKDGQEAEPGSVFHKHPFSSARNAAFCGSGLAVHWLIQFRAIRPSRNRIRPDRRVRELLTRNPVQLFLAAGVHSLIMKFRSQLFSVLAVSSVVLASCKPTPPPSAAASPTPSQAAQSWAPPALGAIASPSANAERGPRGGGDFAARAKERFEKMKSDLALTEEQTAKIQPILDKQLAAGQALRADESLDRKQVMDKMKEFRQAVEAEISVVLTPEQNAKWAELKAQRDAEMANRKSKREKGEGKGAGTPPPSQ
jgi:protein CpxP